jgi:hypothetical protein
MIPILVTTYARTVITKERYNLGVCMLEKDKQFPCDCVEFKGIEGKK